MINSHGIFVVIQMRIVFLNVSKDYMNGTMY